MIIIKELIKIVLIGVWCFAYSWYVVCATIVLRSYGYTWVVPFSMLLGIIFAELTYVLINSNMLEIFTNWCSDNLVSPKIESLIEKPNSIHIYHKLPDFQNKDPKYIEELHDLWRQKEQGTPEYRKLYITFIVVFGILYILNMPKIV